MPARAVQLPDDREPLLEGALALVPAATGGFDLVTIDYGSEVPLGHADDEASAADLLIDYLDRPLPTPRRIGVEEYGAIAERTLTLADELRPRLTQGSILTQLPPGLAVDRIGALDGVQLFPATTAFEARSLPPTALVGAEVHRFITETDVLVRAQLAAPWFGQPGGGVRLTLAEDFAGIRDLVVNGSLTRVEVV